MAGRLGNREAQRWLAVVSARRDAREDGMSAAGSDERHGAVAGDGPLLLILAHPDDD